VAGEVQMYSFLTLSLGKGGWETSHSDRFTPGEETRIHWTGWR